MIVLQKVEYIENEQSKEGLAVLDLGAKYVILPKDGSAFLIKLKEDVIKL